MGFHNLGVRILDPCIPCKPFRLQYCDHKPFLASDDAHNKGNSGRGTLLVLSAVRTAEVFENRLQLDLEIVKTS